MLVDQTEVVGPGIGQGADVPLSIRKEATEPSMAGMYVAPQALASDVFKNAAKPFISPDGPLISLIREESGSGISFGIIRAVGSAGGVITSALIALTGDANWWPSKAATAGRAALDRS